jgi:hypothetical protein
MTPQPSLDRESFQKFLANAFAVQNSGFNRPLLSALVEVQRFVTADEFTVDHALHLIADRALKVSSASGIAIALLHANELVYRAGSGIAATEVGRHMPAVLSMCSPSKAGVEILRVENAQSDARIEAEICRQFGLASLLILPICRADVVVGVLQVHFVEPHTFVDEELRTYRLMAGLVEEAVSRNLQRSPKHLGHESHAGVPAMPENRFEEVFSGNHDHFLPPEPNPAPPFAEHLTPESTIFDTTVYDRSVFNRLRFNKLRFNKLIFDKTILNRTIDRWASIATQWKPYRPSIGKLWQVGVVATACISFVLAIWIAHRHHAAPTMSDSTLSTPADAAGVIPAPFAHLSSGDKRQRSIPGLKDTMAPSAAFRRVTIGPNEVDYVAEDVTVRNFTASRRHETRSNFREVNIGPDVKVRYFAAPSTLSQKTTAPLATPVSSQLSAAPE